MLLDMDIMNETKLIDDQVNVAENTVIDDLENEKLQVLNTNASTTTLNMQNFIGTAGYPENREEIHGGNEPAFECTCKYLHM